MVARVAAVREAVGDEVDIGIDLHRRFSPYNGSNLREGVGATTSAVCRGAVPSREQRAPVGVVALNDSADCDGGTPFDAVEFPGSN